MKSRSKEIAILNSKKKEYEEFLNSNPPKKITDEFIRKRNEVISNLNTIRKKIDNLKLGRGVLGDSIKFANLVGVDDFRRYNIGQR